MCLSFSIEATHTFWGWNIVVQVLYLTLSDFWVFPSKVLHMADNVYFLLQYLTVLPMVVLTEKKIMIHLIH